MLDPFDKRLLTALQKNGRLTNNELAELIGLSPSQCSRRRTRLENDGLIKRYCAVLDREHLGLGIVSIVAVTLASHSKGSEEKFAQLAQTLPEVQEVHKLTGEMDYFIKVATVDLKAMSRLIYDVLLVHESVMNVRTSIVLDTLKETSALPI